MKDNINYLSTEIVELAKIESTNLRIEQMIQCLICHQWYDPSSTAGHQCNSYNPYNYNPYHLYPVLERIAVALEKIAESQKETL